jgi:hypothetical protein
MFVGTNWKAVYLWYELMLTNCFYSQKQVGKATCAAVLKALRTRRKPSNPNHIIFLSDENFLNQDHAARTTDIIVLTLRMSLLLCTPKTAL